MINKQDFIDHLTDALPNSFVDEKNLSKEVIRALKTYTWKSGDFVTSTVNGKLVICVFDKFDTKDTFISSFSVGLGNDTYIKERFYIDDFRDATAEECRIISKAVDEAGYRWLYGMILPKFGIGQYVVDESSNEVYIITEIVDNVYNCKDLDGNTGALLINDKERNLPLHAWTIDDAKPGQLLASKKDKVYVNFKEIDPNNSFYFLSTWDVDGTDASVNMNPGDDWVSDAFVPANKQQKEEVKHIMELNGYVYIKLTTPNDANSSDKEDLLSLIKSKYPNISNKEILKLLTDATYKLVNGNQSWTSIQVRRANRINQSNSSNRYR